ncbi:MAG: hypothetical protein VX641_00470 [Planctomycetota bacterium]|nr:hypothetical protein [Planctomycetota bacterium]
MARVIQPERGLLIASGVVLILALLPTRWLAGWTADVGAIVALPLTPLRHAASGAVEWVRPTGGSGLPIDPSSLDLLQQERDTYRGRWHSARLRIQQLEEELRQIQGARSLGVGEHWTPRTAEVVRHNPSRRGGVLSLNVGSRSGVRAGTVAVVDGDRLVGHIAPDVPQLTSQLIPLGASGHAASETLAARILEPEARAVDVYDEVSGRAIHLELIDGTGDYRGVLERGSGVQPGQPVRLGTDPAWNSTAWGMLVGYVDRIEQVPEQPLREVIFVRPAVRTERLSSVTLKIVQDHDPLQAIGGEENLP